MNYDDMPELPPIDAYDDAPSEIGDDAASDNLAFADGQSRQVGDSTKPSPATPKILNRWTLNSASDWDEATIPRRLWIAPAYLMRGKVSTLIGAPEAGKSTIALRWGIALALHEAFGDFKPKPLPGQQRRAYRVMSLNMEDDEAEQQRRISALMRGSGRLPRELGDNFIRISPNDEGNRDGRFSLFGPNILSGEPETTEALAELEKSIIAQQVDVLFLDPLAELLGGLDENSNPVMSFAFAQLRSLAARTGIAICIVHHVKKGGGVAGNLEAARGGGALGGSVRCAWTVAPMSEDEASGFGIPVDKRKSYLRLDSAKQSYSPPAEGAAWCERWSVPLDNGDTAAGLAPWKPPATTALTADDLAPLIADIQAGPLAGGAYSPKLSTDQRSVRHVLEKYGHRGAAQTKVLDLLKQDHGLKVEAFTLRGDKNRNLGTKQGLRIGDLPAAEWVNCS